MAYIWRQTNIFITDAVFLLNEVWGKDLGYGIQMLLWCLAALRREPNSHTMSWSLIGRVGKRWKVARCDIVDSVWWQWRWTLKKQELLQGCHLFVYGREKCVHTGNPFLTTSNNKQRSPSLLRPLRHLQQVDNDPYHRTHPLLKLHLPEILRRSLKALLYLLIHLPQPLPPQL